MEEPLPNGGSCLLGSINLSAYVTNGSFDYGVFMKDIHTIVRGMNEVLDQGLPLHPLQIQRDTVKNWRQIGIGIMGLADMLIKLGIRYDTDEAQTLCDNIGFILSNEAIKSSALLAKEFGAYPKYNGEKVLSSKFLIENTISETYEMVEKYGLRNSQILTIAPTGSLSTMLGISGGIEPIFSLSYTRKTESLHAKDVYYKVFTPIAEEYMKKHGLTEEEELPNFFVTAQNLDPFKRVEMQGVWQKHIDASISSTINLPNKATVEEVKELYIHAWKNKLKGMTIYRDNCARSGVLTLGENTEEEVGLKRGEWKELADDTYYIKRNLKIGCGKLKLFVGYSPSEQEVQDLYIVKSGQGGCEKNLQAIAITISALLRVGGNLNQLRKAYSGITACPSFSSSRAKGIEISKGNYCGMAIINEVEAFLKEVKPVDTKEIKENKKKSINKSPSRVEKEIFTQKEKDFMTEYGETAFAQRYNKCPQCGERIEHVGGCIQCMNCSYTKCE